MSYKRRFQTLQITVPTAAASTPARWRAPYPCTIVAIHGRRDGGAAGEVNAQINATDILAANLVCGNGSFASSTTLAASDVAAGDTVSLEIAVATTTPTITVQVDIEIDANVADI